MSNFDVYDAKGFHVLHNSVLETIYVRLSVHFLGHGRALQGASGHDYDYYIVQFSSVTHLCPSVCHSMDCSTPGLPVHHQLPVLLKLMSIELAMPSNHLILYCPLLLPSSTFPRIRGFPMSRFFISGGQNIGASASTSILSIITQD